MTPNRSFDAANMTNKELAAEIKNVLLHLPMTASSAKILSESADRLWCTQFEQLVPSPRVQPEYSHAVEVKPTSTLKGIDLLLWAVSDIFYNNHSTKEHEQLGVQIHDRLNTLFRDGHFFVLDGQCQKVWIQYTSDFSDYRIIMVGRAGVPLAFDGEIVTPLHHYPFNIEHMTTPKEPTIEDFIFWSENELYRKLITDGDADCITYEMHIKSVNELARFVNMKEASK